MKQFQTIIDKKVFAASLDFYNNVDCMSFFDSSQKFSKHQLL